ncbi:MAG: cytochrome c biogenesis protein [Anaerolineae bacterium]
MATRPDRRELVWIGGTALALAAALGMVFLYAPTEATMGAVQRIFYWHAASAWVGFAAFAVTCGGGIAYLVRGRRRWDALALSSVEVGLTFITMAVLSGSCWARAVWGVYWTWEPRLTISAVQLLAYVAYLMLRASLSAPERVARYAAVYGVAAFATVPLSWFAIRWWRTIHPDLLTGGGGMALAPRMVQTLVVSLVAFTLLYVVLVRRRVGLEELSASLAELREEIDSEEEAPPALVARAREKI